MPLLRYIELRHIVLKSLVSVLLAGMVLTINVQNVFANSPGIEGVPNTTTHSDIITSSSHDKSKQCRMDGFCKIDPQKTTTGHSTKHHKVTHNTATAPIQALVQSITYCNNTPKAGQFTDFFNKIGGCPVKVLFKSPN